MTSSSIQESPTPCLWGCPQLPGLDHLPASCYIIFLQTLGQSGAEAGYPLALLPGALCFCDSAACCANWLRQGSLTFTDMKWSWLIKLESSEIPRIHHPNLYL